MKLCPQCAFIYEDNQRVCDMDGNKLIHKPEPVVPQQSVSTPSRLTINLPAKSESLPAKSRSRRFPILVIVGIVLAALLSVLYFAAVHRSRSSSAVLPSIQSSPRSASEERNPEPSPADVASSTSIAVAPLPEQPPKSPDESLSSVAPSSSTTVEPARLGSTPISAGVVSADSRGPVILRLTNGATIKADAAWETKEGIWYRQGSVLTFLKRSQVKTIQRPEPSQPQPKLTASSREITRRKADNSTAQNRRLESAEAGKQSRVSSFLKMTGKILKKPFKW